MNDLQRRIIIVRVAAGIFILLAALGLAVLFSSTPAVRIAMRTAKPEELTARTSARVVAVNLSGTFRKGPGVSGTLAGSWPRFRGERMDNIVHETPPLSSSMGAPKVLWSLDLGEGYAGPAVANGRVYIIDYDEASRSDVIRVHSVDDGRELWRRSYKNDIKRNHGMSRTTPAVAGNYLVTIGPKCHVVCLDAATGDFRWGIDLVKEEGTKVPLWYAGQCPLIDNGIAVIAPGGKNILIGIDCASGKVVWRTPNTARWNMSHASVMPVTLLGRRMYVYPALGGVIGVSAGPGTRGEVLFTTTAWNASIIVPSAVPIGTDKLFLTAGYGVGSAVFTLAPRGGGFSVTRTAQYGKETFASEQQTPILYNGRLFTVMPADAMARKQQLVSMTTDGKVIWESGKDDRFGLGAYMIADGKIFLLDDNGMLTCARADGTSYQRLYRVKILSGRESWAPMAMISGRLIARDSKRMVCIDVRAR
ncbi:MAG: PQQ-binding-like beta-propeller repeat protein [Spirochaetota bacterium]